LWSLFLLLEAASGLKVNLAKSNLIPMGNVDQEGKVSRHTRVWGCLFAGEVSWSSFGGSYKSTHIWDSVIEKIEHRLVN